MGGYAFAETSSRRLFVSGGIENEGRLIELVTGTGKMIDRSDMNNQRRFNCLTAYIDRFLLATGGYFKNFNLKSCEVYDT